MKNLDISDHNGHTALHIASTRSEYCTKKLLDAGSSPLVTTHQGLTPLHVAARAQQSNIVGLLVLSLHELSWQKSCIGQDTSIQNDKEEEEEGKALHIIGIDATDEKGYSPLYYAVRSGRPEAVKILIEFGANINTGGDLFKACSEFEDDNATRAATLHFKHDPLTQREAQDDNLVPCEGSSPFVSAKPKYSVIESSRLEEIVVMLVDCGTEVSVLKDGLILDCLWQGKSYTASCLFDRVPISLWTEPDKKDFYTTILSRHATEYDSSVAQKCVLPIMAGTPNPKDVDLYLR